MLRSAPALLAVQALPAIGFGQKIPNSSIARDGSALASNCERRNVHFVFTLGSQNRPNCAVTHRTLVLRRHSADVGKVRQQRKLQSRLRRFDSNPTTVDNGDVLRVRLAGGGGHGDPLLRDAAAVLDDVLEEKMTICHARTAYGVVIGGNPLAVDEAQTARLRAR